jgi:hypothetical protein
MFVLILYFIYEKKLIPTPLNYYYDDFSDFLLIFEKNGFYMILFYFLYKFFIYYIFIYVSKVKVV